MGIGYRIKEARERLGLTQTELGKKVGVTGSAITNYEKETSHPKEQVIYKLMEVLNVDANYLFQDVVKVKSHTSNVTLAEYDMIEKYRKLDSDGKETVDFILNKEYKRCFHADYSVYESDGTMRTIEKVKKSNPNDRIIAYADAAHEIAGSSAEDQQHDEEIMNGEDF